MVVVGWWMGYLFFGYFVFVNVDSIGWNGVYYIMVGVVGLLMLFILLVGELYI